MKKLLLPVFALCAALTTNAQSKKIGTFAIDEFNTVEPYFNAAGEGIAWFVGEKRDTTVYKLERTEEGMVVHLTDASYDPTTFKVVEGDTIDTPDYYGFGFSFGDSNGELEGGFPHYIDLAENSNADITISVTNNADVEVFMTIQLQDTANGLSEIMPDDASTIDWGNRWQKTAVTLAAGATETITLDLSSIESLLGGYAVVDWACTSGDACPNVSYDLDPSALKGLYFIVNGGSSEAGGGADDAERAAATGELVFNYISIGDTTKGMRAGAPIASVASTVEGFSVSPNPASSVLNVAFVGEATVSVSSLVGVVSSQVAVDGASVDVSGLAAGTYTVKVVTASAVSTAKVVVE